MGMNHEHPAEETPDQLLLGNQLCFPLYAAARKVVNAYGPLLKPLGLTYTQYIAFLSLWEKGEETVGDMCRQLYLDCGTMTPVLKRMEENGWIIRCRCREDERVVRVTLTESGRAMRDKVRGIPEQLSGCVCLSEEKARALHGLLYELLDGGRKRRDEDE